MFMPRERLTSAKQTPGGVRLRPGWKWLFLVWALILASALEAIHDSTARQVVRRQFYAHTISEQDANVVLAHPARDVGQDLVTAVELDS